MLGVDEFLDPGRAARTKYRIADLLQRCTERLIVHRPVEAGGQYLDDVLRQPGGRGNSEPDADRIIGITALGDGDRKSTRLNSSHQIISYAVFCLKKKKRQRSRRSQGVPKRRSRARNTPG